MLSTMLGSCAGTAHGAPRQTDLKGTLFAFISEAAAAKIVSGVQVSLLNELAVQFSGKRTLLNQHGLRPFLGTSASCLHAADTLFCMQVLEIMLMRQGLCSRLMHASSFRLQVHQAAPYTVTRTFHKLWTTATAYQMLPSFTSSP